MKLAVVGSRSFNDYAFLEEQLKSFSPKEIVTGGARGADTQAAIYAVRNKIKLTVFPANWSLYGRSAGFRRNAEIVQYCDELVAFWDGKSPGTKHTLDLAASAGKVAIIYLRTGAAT